MRKTIWLGAILTVAIAAGMVMPVWGQGEEGEISLSPVVESGRRSDGTDQGGPGTSRWKQDETGWYWQEAGGERLKDSWYQDKGIWYYLGADGYMLTDSWVDTGDKRYWVGSDGGMLSGQTITVDGVDYVLDDTGALMAPAKTEEELQAEAIAGQIVASLTHDGMDKRQKASAIYRYIRRNMTYTYGGPRPNVGDAAAALYAFRRHTGNCYEYYAMARYMLEAAGMPGVMVTRASDADHYWNLVQVDGAWYHFDATPRRTGGEWCLVTTGQLRSSWRAHNFNVAAYPATP